MSGLTMTSALPPAIARFPSTPIQFTIIGTNLPTSAPSGGSDPGLYVSTSTTVRNPGSPFVRLTWISTASDQRSMVVQYTTQSTSSLLTPGRSYFISWIGTAPNTYKSSNTAIIRFNDPDYTLTTPTPNSIFEDTTTPFTVSANVPSQPVFNPPTVGLSSTNTLPLSAIDNINNIPLTFNSYTTTPITNLPYTAINVTYNANTAPLGTYYVYYDNGFGTVFSTDTLVIVANTPGGTEPVIITAINPEVISTTSIPANLDLTLAGALTLTSPGSGFLTTTPDSITPDVPNGALAFASGVGNNIIMTLTSPAPAPGKYYITLTGYPLGTYDGTVFSGNNFLYIIDPIISIIAPNPVNSGETIALGLLGTDPGLPTSAYLTLTPNNTTNPVSFLTIDPLSDPLSLIATLDVATPSGNYYITLEYGRAPSLTYVFIDPNQPNLFLTVNEILPPEPNPICFKEDTKISCLKDNQETNIFIQNLKKGDLVKTLKNGYLPVSVVGKSNCYNPKNTNRIKSRLYKLSKDKYPELTEDLVVTGCHSVLVDYISSDKKEQIESEMGKLYVTDNKYRMPAFLDERSDIYTEEYGDIDVYHVALGDDESRNYGIYANGLLVESCFIPRIKNEMIVIS